MDVGNLSYLAHPDTRKLVRWKLLVLLALICIPLLATGCFCLNIGGCGCDHAEPNGVLAQKGKFAGANGGPMTIYYPVPYASPPNLELHDPFHNYTIVDQRADSFRIVQDQIHVGPGGIASDASVEWTARGVRSPATLPAATVAASPPSAAEPQPIATTSYGR